MQFDWLCVGQNEGDVDGVEANRTVCPLEWSLKDFRAISSPMI